MRAGVLVAALLGGCLSAPSSPFSETPLQVEDALVPDDFVNPLISNHSHAEVSLHELSYHMKQVFHHPLAGSRVASSHAHALDLVGPWLFVATQGSQAGTEGGLWIFDAKQPEAPRLVGRLAMFGNLGGDRSMEATDDGDWVVLGTELLACGVQIHPWGPGFYLIDTRDKATPRIVDYVPDQGVHSLVIHRIAGEDYVFPDSSGRIFKIEKQGPRPHLVAVGNFESGHDGAIYDDPELGIPLFYAALADRLQVYDVSDPTQPKTVSRWSKGEMGGHYSHMVTVDWIEGHRIVAFEMEDWEKDPSPIFMLDATDFEEITRLGTWTNPAQVPANGYEGGAGSIFGFDGQLTFSTHNPELEDGILYVAHYHGGVWMLDARTLEKVAAPRVLGYYLPHDDNGGFVPRGHEGIYPKPDPYCGFRYDKIPNVYDIEVQDGLVYAVDYHTGLYVVTADP